MLIIAGHRGRALMIPAALLVRRPPALEAAAQGRGRLPQPSRNSGMTVRQAVRSPQFLTLMLANFFCCATHSGPIFHTVSYAVTCGIPMLSAPCRSIQRRGAGRHGRAPRLRPGRATSFGARSACW
jgi:hypothetical protein